jgi:hypothetical protein
MYKICILAAVCLIGTGVAGQVSIGAGGTNDNAELVVHASDKGVLLPRMPQDSMLAIVLPANGLLVYNTDKKNYYYYDATASEWKPASFAFRSSISDATGKTRLEVERTPNDDIIRFAADADGDNQFSGAADDVANLDADGFNLLSESSTYRIEGQQVLRQTGNNFFAGTGGQLLAAGERNSAFGFGALSGLTSGSDNTAIGYDAASNLATGSGGVYVGHGVASAGASNISGINNSISGYMAAPLLSGAASNNTILGSNAAPDITTGSGNIIIGHGAGAGLTTGSNNIIIGNGISVSNADTSGMLDIAGMIGSDNVYDASGRVRFANSYTFPDTTGRAGMTMVMGDNGMVHWDEKSVAGQASVTVSGAATNMQPYNRILSTGNRPTGGQVYFVPTVAMANGTISRMSTYLVNANGPKRLQMGLYVVTGTTANVAVHNGVELRGEIDIDNNMNNSIVTIEFPGAAYEVVAGQQYYLVLFSSNSSGHAVLLQRVDNDNKCSMLNITTDLSVYDIESVYSNLGITGDLIWMRAH